MTPEFIALLQKTSMKLPQDLVLTEVPQKVYEEAYEFLIKKYGSCIGRTNLMLNGWLITPKLEDMFRVHAAMLTQTQEIAKLEQNELES